MKHVCFSPQDMEERVLFFIFLMFFGSIAHESDTFSLIWWTTHEVTPTFITVNGFDHLESIGARK